MRASPTATPPARRSCRRRRTPTSPSWRAAAAGGSIGDLVALLTILKGLPLTYNRDLQEDKEPLFDAVDTTAATLRMLTEVITVVHFDVDAMRRAASDAALQATDIAEHLVANGVPFREAHTIVGALVAQTLASGRTLADLTFDEWQLASVHFTSASSTSSTPTRPSAAAMSPVVQARGRSPASSPVPAPSSPEHAAPPRAADSCVARILKSCDPP